ncbi:hypothetical protein EMCRGX_G002587 [Ephydatia muelleri]
MSLQIIHTTVNCKTKTMAVFLAGGNEGPGKLCCSEQRDNSSHSPVLTSKQCAGRSHVHVDEWKEYTSSGGTLRASTLTNHVKPMTASWCDTCGVWS